VHQHHHTEASVNLAMLAGLLAVVVLCDIVDDIDDFMARLPNLHVFVERENLKVTYIVDLIR
jgi:3,4-dihydroxy-2-butanone 4-phosphate synthase